MKKVNIILLSLAAVLSIGTATLVSSYKNTIETSATVGNYSTDADSYYNGITATSGKQLAGQLHDLITSTHKTYTDYDDSGKYLYQQITDQYYDSNNQPVSGKLRDFYTGVAWPNAWDPNSGSKTGGYNREHVWVKSLSQGLWTKVTSGNKSGGADMHHIRPLEHDLNSTRNSNPYGEIENRESHQEYANYGGNKTYALGGYLSGGVFEPLDSAKGDVARIILYVYLHYNSCSITDLFGSYAKTNGDGSSSYFKTGDKLALTSIMAPNDEEEAAALLLKWNKNDPVDYGEQQRNEWVAKYQGNRNPFIDNPNYADAIWGDTSVQSVTLSESSGNVAVNSTLSFDATSSMSGTFTTVSSDTSIATVSHSYNSQLSKYVVTVTGKSVGSTTITVKMKNNGVEAKATFFVTVYDPTAPKTLNSISLSGNPPTMFTVGDEFSHEGMTVTANYSDTSSDDVTSYATFSGYDMLSAGKQTVTVSYTDSYGSASATYSITVKQSSSQTSDDFALYSGTITEGDYVIYYNGKAMNTTVTSNRLQYEEVTPSNDTITTDDSSIIWHIAASGNYWTIYNADEAKYAASTGTKNQATMVSSINDNAKWTVTGTSTYEFENLARSTGSDSGNKWLRNNGTYGFACYSTSTGGALSLYKRTESSITYTISYDSNGGSGTMEDTVGTNPIVAECTFTAPDGYHFSHWNTELDDNGDDYDPDDVVEQDLSLYAIWEEDVVVQYSVSYNANGGTGTMTDTNSPYNSGATVTVLSNTFTRSGFTFVNWNTAADGTGTAYNPNATFTISADTILYAQWTSSDTPTGTDFKYYKVSDVADVTTGVYVIAAKINSTYYAMSNTFASKITQSTVAVANNSVITANVSSRAVTITKTSTGYTISNSTQYLKYKTNTDFETSEDPYLWSISAGLKGTFRIVSSSVSNRGLIYRAGSVNKYGAYSTSNVTAGGTEYYDVELFKAYTASDFANTFLTKLTCNAQGTSAPSYSTGYSWSTLSDEYTNKLTDSEKSKFVGANANESGSVIEQAVARYDYILSKYGHLKDGDDNPLYPNFMNRSIPSAGLNILVLTNNDTSSWLIIVISVISLSVISLYIFKRRKKYDN